MFLLALISVFLTNTSGYELVREYAGSTFFQGFEYYGLYDNLTLGNVVWVDEDTAVRGNLTYITPKNTAVIRVDNYTTVPYNGTRNSVRLTTKDFYDFGSLWIFDAVHLPFGCSVWPAWWTKGLNWPNGGELDIVENINLAKSNQMAVHTTQGCFHTAAPDQTGMSGVNNADCSPGSGCVIGQNDPQSWGQGFALAGGGVWATQFDVGGIYVWFWSRRDVPSSLSPSGIARSLDTSTWGPPTASWLNTTCDLPKFFTAQQLILDITLCGVWAGVPPIYDSTCGSQPPNDPTNPISAAIPRTPSCYADNVVGPGARFDDAYFEINYIRAYSTVAPSPTATSYTTSTSFATAAASAAATTTGVPGNAAGKRPSSAAVPTIRLALTWVVFGVVLCTGAMLI